MQYGSACGNTEFGTRVNLVKDAAKEVAVSA
jgi:hypothetical protein